MNKSILDFEKGIQRKDDFSLAIGFFDGLHVGHRLLLDELKTSKYPPCVLTFSTDFKSRLFHQKEELLLSEEEKEEMLSSFGIETEYILPFDERMVSCSIDEFLSFLSLPSLKMIVIGKDFTFAKKAEGKASDLLFLKDKDVRILDLFYQDGRKVSSSLIKQDLRNLDFEKAAKELGYPFFLKGKVIHGLKNGRKIDFPTANTLYPKKKLKLPNGVYETRTLYNGKEYKSMTNIGNHPTVSPLEEDIVETHLLSFDGDLYDQEIKISFVSYLRPQKKFDSLSSLKEQLEMDLSIIKSR